MSRNPSDISEEDRLTIICLYCNKAQVVSRRALVITCRHCNKSLRLEDITVKDYLARRSVETCGVVTVEKRGQIVSDRLLCGGLIVRGKVKSTITCRGLILVGPEAQLKGNVTAPSLAVGAGAIIEGHYTIGSAPTPSDQPDKNSSDNRLE